MGCIASEDGGISGAKTQEKNAEMPSKPEPPSIELTNIGVVDDGAAGKPVAYAPAPAGKDGAEGEEPMKLSTASQPAIAANDVTNPSINRGIVPALLVHVLGISEVASSLSAQVASQIRGDAKNAGGRITTALRRALPPDRLSAIPPPPGASTVGSVLDAAASTVKKVVKPVTDAHLLTSMVEVTVDGAVADAVRTREVVHGDPQFDQLLEIGANAADIESWDLKKVSLVFTYYYKGARPHRPLIQDTANAVPFLWQRLGSARLTLSEMLKPGDHREGPAKHRLLLEGSVGDPLFLSGSKPPRAAELHVSIVAPLPPRWPPFLPLPPPTDDAKFPKHVFIVTRGTRGDVQPFVALARGLCNEHGYLVTICSESKFRDFVLTKCSDVASGEVRFLSSGGDTETQKNQLLERIFLEEFGDSVTAQMIMLAASEAYFFSSIPVIVQQLQHVQAGVKPVDLIVPGFTMVGAGLLLSEYFKVPVAGFILQPTAIPALDMNWVPVDVIQKPSALGGITDYLAKNGIDLHPGNHKSLEYGKRFVEEVNPTGTTLTGLRRTFGLPARSTWSTVYQSGVPMVMPIQAQAIDRPTDWPEQFETTDFIFLRSGGGAESSLPDDLLSFITNAKSAGRKLMVMSFSSMAVSRKAILDAVDKMLNKSKVPCALIYVGKPGDTPSAVMKLKDEGKFFETARADFGVLFKQMDCFIVHGGLGTTVEALRMHKPIVVTGPLLLDQRFWGNVIAKKGVGPPPCFLADFPSTCVDFVDKALCENSPYLEAAQSLDWGDETDDGVSANVAVFARLIVSNLKPIGDEEASQPKA